jgi:hypothetical protein
MRKIVKRLQTFLLLLSCCWGGTLAFAQQFPSAEEGFPWMITFGKQGLTSWGDDDFSQTFFFVVPPAQKKPIYIRVLDPDCGGANDELKSEANTTTKFAVYGGRGAVSHPDVLSGNPIGAYDAGTVLREKTFGVDPKADGQWYTFGPLNPSEGELALQYGGYVFKIIVSGLTGDDGNVYKFFLSDQPDANRSVQSGNGFTFEYCLRMPSDDVTCHLYTWISQGVVSVQQSNFDWDDDGTIRLYSPAKAGIMAVTSHENDWARSQYPIEPSEVNAFIDFRLNCREAVKHNNVVLRIANQYGASLPFVSIPIGGGLAYKPEIKMKKIGEK